MMKGILTLLLLLALAAVFLFSLPVFAEEGEKGEAGVKPAETAGFNFGASLVSLFRDHLSAVDSDRCPSYPTCSSYSVEAFRKHGFFMGWLMTVDRLIHEGREETVVSPLIYSEGRWKIYDPVDNNDFWWYRPEKMEP